MPRWEIAFSGNLKESGEKEAEKTGPHKFKCGARAVILRGEYQMIISALLSWPMSMPLMMMRVLPS